MFEGLVDLYQLKTIILFAIHLFIINLELIIYIQCNCLLETLMKVWAENLKRGVETLACGFCSHTIFLFSHIFFNPIETLCILFHKYKSLGPYVVHCCRQVVNRTSSPLVGLQNSILVYGTCITFFACCFAVVSI